MALNLTRVPGPATPGLSRGINQASAASQRAGSNIPGIYQRIGMLHLKDQQAEFLLDAFKQHGFDKDPALKALFTAADKGPLGAKSMALRVLQNYMSMAQQISMLTAKREIDGGGFINTDVRLPGTVNEQLSTLAESNSSG